MRLSVLLFAAMTACYGCAPAGFVVEKIAEPSPFAFSLGTDMNYRFTLRDRAGVIHSQLVNADVFYAYQVGDYFDSLQPPPRPRAGYSKDAKEIAQTLPPYRETIPVRVPRFQPIPLRPGARPETRPDVSNARHQ